MPEWSKFTDSEIELIKYKLNHKFERGMIIVILISPIICLIMPYIPGRRGRGPLIDRMPYWDAVLQMSLIWFATLIGVWIWNYLKTKKQYSENKIFLKKTNEIGEITGKSKSFFSTYANKIITNLEGDLGIMKIEKKESQSLNIGDKVEVIYEQQTKTIFEINKQ